VLDVSSIEILPTLALQVSYYGSRVECILTLVSDLGQVNVHRLHRTIARLPRESDFSWFALKIFWVLDQKPALSLVLRIVCL